MASIALALPILPGKTEQWKHFCQERVGPRKSEYEASCQRLGMTREASYLQQTPHGDLAVVYLEAHDIPRLFEDMGRSQDPFDVWFRQQAKEIHGMDLSQPLPGPLPVAFVDWQVR
jgi:hypothetical protein